MISDTHLIQADRLDLILMTSAFLAASLASDAEAAAGLIKATIPPEWLTERAFIQRRLRQVQSDPPYQPWMPRAICLREQGLMIGHIGFHTQPGADYLRDYAPHGVEFGYTIFAPFRQQGYATEACAALMQWATDAYQVQHFVLSISPGNLPSLRIAQHFGFQKVGTQMDEEDGPEDIFVLDHVEG
jgi:[ribosomal protein S5]-alanine N-acetyltransferase